MKNTRIRLVVLLGTFSIVLIIIFQLYWVFNTFSITENQFNQRVEIALYRVAEKITEFNNTQLPYDPVQQITSNYFIVNVADVINSSILEHYLLTEFDRNNIKFDYEYAIYDCETDKMVYGKYINVTTDDKQKPSKDEFRKDAELVYYFGVIFPSKRNYLVSSLNIWIISSIIILTALLFFVYAITIILKQKKMSDIQKDFINNLTHEFKTPISTISIAADVLSEKEIINDPHRLLKYATIISEQNIRLEKQIEKVLQIASLERSRVKLKLEEIDLHEIIKEVAGNFDPAKTNKESEFHYVLLDEPVLIRADRHHFVNVIYNLIDNAIKYCENPVVIISTNKNDSNILLGIKDNGPGIDKKHLKRIFNKFYRVPSGDIHNIKGFGLGLNYVKYIINVHGWKITVNSKVGQGSEFCIIIPH